jgi:hypothetical protein
MILKEEIDKIRAVRHRISARCGHDPKRLLEHYQQVSRKMRASGQFRFAETAWKEAGLALHDEPPRSGS